MRFKSKLALMGLTIIQALTAILAFLELSGCASDIADPVIDFVGDSIIARWDINQDFPSYYVYNYGVGGSGIELLKSYDSKFNGNDVVVMSGTNDHPHFSPEKRNEYAMKYLTAVEALTDRRIYLISVLPRKFDGDRNNINSDIKAFNHMIRSLTENYANITYIDVYNDFLKGTDIDPRYYSDGLHPNAMGYEILTQKLLKVL